MDELLSLVARFLAHILVELFFGTLCYWAGWPWVKLFTLGKYPRHGWLSGRREETYVQCVGLAVLALVLMAALGQFSF
ncbi:MAG: hypothetical protein NDI70_02775 [Pseudomonas sagittaria]|nr:hypothetical protein [Pseudomonas sagittaria]